MSNDDLTHDEFRYTLLITQLAVRLKHRGAEAALKALEKSYAVDDQAVRKINDQQKTLGNAAAPSAAD